MSLTKIGSIGVSTGIQFAGVTTVATLHVGSGVTLSSDGDIFVTGISTFSEDIKVGSGITLSPDGDGFYTGVVTATTFSGALAASSLTGALPAISGANLTNLDASDLASGTVPTARLGSGTASSSTFLRGDSTFQTVNTDLVSDTSPQLGGNLDVNTKNILFGDSSDGSTDDVLKFGAGSDLSIFHSGTYSMIKQVNAGTGDLYIDAEGSKSILIRSGDGSSGAEAAIVCNANAATELYHSGTKKFETTSNGVRIPDDIYLGLGDSDDLNIRFLNGTGAFIQSAGNTMYIRSNLIELGDNSGNKYIKCIDGAATELYHNSVKKLETSAAGIKLNGADSNGAQFQLGAGNDFQIEHDGSNSYIYNLTNDLVIQNDASVKITAKSGGTQRFRFDSDGLKFGTDSAAANALDDYEEGTFIPSFTCSSGSIAPNPSYNNLAYTKIGRVVHVTGQLVLSNASSPSGNLDFVGLPFAGHSGTQISERAYNIQLGYFNGSGKPANNHYSFVLRIDGQGATTARMEGIDAHEDGSIADWTGNGTDLWFCFTYFTDS